MIEVEETVVSSASNNEGHVSFLAVVCNYLFRLLVLWIVLRIISDIDTVEDWIVSWDRLFYVPGSIAAIGLLLLCQFLRDCYKRCRFGHWFHNQFVLPKNLVLGGVWWAALIPLVFLLSCAFDKRVKELSRGKGIDVDKVEFVEREEAQSDHASSSNVNGQLK